MSLLESNAAELKVRVSDREMLPPGRLWWGLLVLLTSARALEISGVYNDEVICSQGLTRCSMRDTMSFPAADDDSVDVHKLTPHVKLCCRDALCRLCLVVEAELYEQPGQDRKPKGSVTVCYKTPATFPTCKKVTFKGNGAALTEQEPAKVSVVIVQPDGVFFSSDISVYLHKSPNLSRQVAAPSEAEVCAQEQQRVEACRGRSGPRLSSVVFRAGWVELQFSGRNDSRPSMCLQYEINGPCQKWNQAVIPLHSLTPCTCLQVWEEQESSWRLLSCPFSANGSTAHASIKELIQRNVWQNVSVSVLRGHGNHPSTMLRWVLSAPCRLEGEVWPCQQEASCREEKAARQQLGLGPWRLNSKGLWENQGEFEDAAPCVTVKLVGLRQQLGPFCRSNIGRRHWSLLPLACFSLLIVSILCVGTKNWGRSCRRAGFGNFARKGLVVLLSPPDVDDGVSESICELGSLLCSRGFGVSLDQWNRTEQCTLGPLPWLHSQLLELNRLGGRVVLVLTQKALMRTDKDPTQASWSPYSDMFTACLCLIEAERPLGTAAQRFLLVTFGSHPHCATSLPEPLWGLSLFQLPSQTQALLSELGG